METNDSNMFERLLQTVKREPLIGVVYLAAFIMYIVSAFNNPLLAFSLRGAGVFLLIVVLLIFLSMLANSLHAHHKSRVASILAFSFLPLVVFAPYYFLWHWQGDSTDNEPTIAQRIENHRSWQQQMIDSMQKDIDRARLDSTIAGKMKRIDMQEYMELLVRDTTNLNEVITDFSQGVITAEEMGTSLRVADSLQRLRVDSFNLYKNNN